MTTTFKNFEEAIAAGAKGTDLVWETCGRCGGTGILPEFHHIHDGVCFDCDGRKGRTIRVSSIKARERRHAKMMAERDAEIAREAELAAKRAQELAQWRIDHPELNAAITELANKGNRFALELKEQDRVPTDNQIAAILKIRGDIDAATDVPEGRQVVAGKVVSVKSELDRFSYHERWTYKMLVEDDRGFRVFGTCPTELLNAVEAAYDAQPTPEFRDRDDWFKTLKGQRVTFTATLEPKEKGFGFFKRPTKASLLDVA